MQPQEFNRGLLQFLDASPTSFHAVASMTAMLDAAGFQPLAEAAAWSLQSGGRYYLTRNASTLVAFCLGDTAPLDSGFRLLGAHTDSPCLKLKPNAAISKNGYSQLGVQVYGGALLNPWFDRDLSLAGRVTYRDAQGALKSALVDFQRPVAVVPSLAIHLDREANAQRSINAQNDIVPLLMCGDSALDLPQVLRDQLQQQYPGLALNAVLDYELSLYDTQPAALTGMQEHFISSARLDNLLSCYVALQALLAPGSTNRLLVCHDHEEVGSQSAVGADSSMLSNILQRVVGDASNLSRTIDRSLLISIDNAHALHPNFVDKHDQRHGPLLNGGPVIKVNANQRYASNSETAALFRDCCERAGVAVQNFVVRADMACGSTIGPISASQLGVKTVDIGLPTLAMHSIRELAGSRDAYALYQALLQFNQRAQLGCD